MSSPDMKRRKKKLPSPTTPTTSIPSLPDDLLLSCLSRVSRLYHPTLSLVSKSFRSLLASPELYKARSLLGHTESCLYVCIYIFSDRNPRWFTLCRKPDKTLTNDTTETKKPSGYVLARAQIPHSPVNSSGHGLVAVGSSIYNIGRSSSSSSVSILDCRTHSWREAPSFPAKLTSLTDGDSDKSFVGVLDTETQIWDPPWRESFYSNSSCIDGKLHLDGKGNAFAYNSKERRLHKMSADSYCEIENVLYSVSDGFLKWYDTKASMWRKLKGLVGLPKFPAVASITLANYGGKMAVLWDEELPYSDGHQTMIWCAEIALERREIQGKIVENEVWGKVEWFDHVLTVPGICDVINVLAATVL